jgi:hypothetical protein
MDIFSLPNAEISLCGIIFFLGFGLRGLLVNRPFTFKSGVAYALTAPIALKIIVIPSMFWLDSFSAWVVIALAYYPLLLLAAAAFIYFSKSYAVLFAGRYAFRDAVIYSLEKNEIMYAENAATIYLEELDIDLKVTFFAFFGIIGVQNKKDRQLLRLIVKGVKAYFKENKIKSNRPAAAIFLAAGVLIALPLIAGTFFM